MDYGTLVTSNDEAHVLYFHVDEVHPDNPRPEYRHFYYVVTSSSSAQDAFLFLCRSLCEAVDQRLRRWHGLYMRWFDKISFETFLQQVRRAPKGNNERRAQDGASELTSPVLYADEASARMGLDQLLRQRDPASISEQKILTARQRSSFTPQKTAAEEVAELKKYQSGQQARNTSSGGVPTRRLKRADTPSEADNLPPPTLGVVAGKKKKVSRSKEPSIKGIQGPPMKAVGAAPQKRPSVSVSPAVPSNARTQGTAEQQLTQARDLLAKQQQDHAKELEYLHAELQALRATVRDDKVHQGDKLQELIQTNKVAVQRIEDSTRQNEEQMKRLYDEALQQRDIRIAQLSEDLIKSQYQNRLHQEESPRMERRAPASDRSASGPRRLASSSMPTTRGDVLASNLVETTADRYMAERVQQLEVQCEQHQLERHHAEEQLKSVSVQLVNLQYELERANYVIDSLKNGLQFVKSELPSLRRDLLHVPPAR